MDSLQKEEDDDEDDDDDAEETSTFQQVTGNKDKWVNYDGDQNCDQGCRFPVVVHHDFIHVLYQVSTLPNCATRLHLWKRQSYLQLRVSHEASQLHPQH